MIFFTHAFQAPIVKRDFGRYYYSVVYLPDELRAELPFDEHPRLRVDAEVDDHPINGAFVPDSGAWYLLLSRDFLRRIGRSLGDVVEVRFVVGDQSAVDLPDALRGALADDSELRAAWDDLTPGKRRGLAHFVASAKTDPTRARRLADVHAALLGPPDPTGPLARLLRLSGPR